MHRCEIKIAPKELMDPDSSYESWLFYESDPHDDKGAAPTWVQMLSYPICDAPATKQLGQMWLCDYHYEWHEDSFSIENCEDPVAILEASNFTEEDETSDE